MIQLSVESSPNWYIMALKLLGNAISHFIRNWRASLLKLIEKDTEFIWDFVE